MALTAVQQNLVSAMQEVAEELLVIKNRLAIIGLMYVTESMSTLSDPELQALSPFAHVTVVELTAAKNALGEINTAMGEYVVGSATTRLTKIVGRVPK